MVSDDTEHTVMVAQSLIVSAGNEDIFAQYLSWQLKLWLLTLPAGVGFATLMGILKLWLGFPPAKSGIFSAGNGPAMRASLLGVCYGSNPEKLRSLVRISTRITHTDIKAEYGSIAVAIASYLSSQNISITPKIYEQQLIEIIPDATEFLLLIKIACRSAESGEGEAEFAAKLGLKKGISGYIYHTIPVVIFLWLRYLENYEKALTEIIKLGGDTDTTAAILGAIIGSRVGKEGIPKSWLNNLWLYPVSLPWLERLGDRLTEVVTNNNQQKYLSFPIYGLWLRNIFFLIIIIGHLGYRLLIL
jgi:ADP-ribosylglycohydrolase